MNQALIDLGEHITGALPEAVQGSEIANDELMLRVSPQDLIKTLTFLRDDQNCQFKMLADVTAVDQNKMSQIMMAKGMLPEGKTIADYLSEETMKKLQSYCEKRNVPLASFSRFKPFMLGIILMMMELQAGGFDAEAGIDMRYLKRAHADKKTVSEMESMEFQMDMFLMKIPLEDQVKAFEKGADDGTILDRLMLSMTRSQFCICMGTSIG